MDVLTKAWDRKAPWLALLTPLEMLFKWAQQRRRQSYLKGAKPVYRAPVPVIIVGNISVGGVGKTPLTIYLAELLRAEGYYPGIVSRGYSAGSKHFPLSVTANTSPLEAGDEPVLLAKRSGCPVVIDPQRPRAVTHLLADHPQCNVIISDDGLQHYPLARDIEIAVVDGSRGVGNGRCLPVGPLREPPERLASVDFVIVNGENSQQIAGFNLQTKVVALVNLVTGEQACLQDWQGKQVNAIAGVGNPQRFFDGLSAAGIQVQPKAFKDHHPFVAADLAFNNGLPVIMTEKDAVKCQPFATADHWYVRIDAEPELAFTEQLLQRMQQLSHGDR